MKILLCTLLLGVYIQLWAQDFDHYKPIQCQGQIPEEFLSDSLLITSSDVTLSKFEDSHAVLKRKAEFIRFSDFYIRQLLRSGDLMFGDPLTEYVNNVAGILLKDFPEVRSQFRFYVTRYPNVNAVCLPNGIVLINIGLLAQLENEAQLAFVLAHEIVHYLKKHGIDAYIESARVRWNPAELRRANYNERIFSIMQYSRELEFIADETGLLDYFLNSGYKLEEADALCDVLLYSEFPVDEEPYTRDLIEDEYFKMPAKYWLDSVGVISSVEDYDDEKLSHPNIKKRRDRIQKIIAEHSDNGKTFILQKEVFFNIREMARFELCNLFMSDRKYIDALYLTHVLQKKHPQSRFLSFVKASSYYGLVRATGESATRIAMRTYDKMKGESQRIFYMLRKLTMKELKIFSCREMWIIHKSIPEDSLVYAMTESAFRQLLNDDMSLRDFFRFDAPGNMKYQHRDTIGEISKYDKIRQNQKNAVISDPFQLAFLSFANDPEFTKFFSRMCLESDITIEKEEFNLERKKYYYKKPEVHNVHKIVVLDPYYYRFSEKSNMEDYVLSSFECERNLLELLSQVPTYSGVAMTILDLGSLDNSDIDKYNDFQLLKSWTGEIPKEGNKGFISSSQKRLNDLASRYGTPYVALCGVISVQPESGKYHYLSEYSFELYDITSGERVYADINLQYKRDVIATLKQMIYKASNAFK